MKNSHDGSTKKIYKDVVMNEKSALALNKLKTICRALHNNVLISPLCEIDFDLLCDACEDLASQDYASKFAFYSLLLYAMYKSENLGGNNQFATLQAYFSDLYPADCQQIQDGIRESHDVEHQTSMFSLNA